MAKDYTWFKFKLPDWMMGKIQKQKPEVRGVFLNLVCKYWQKQCTLTIKDAKDELEEVEYAYANLISKEIIKERGDMLIIDFLDEQWAENQATSEKKSLGGKASASKRIPVKDNPTHLEDNATDVQDMLTGVEDVLTATDFCSTIKNEIREEENREETEEEQIEYNLSDTPNGAPTELKISQSVAVSTFDKRKESFRSSLYPYTKQLPKYTGSYDPVMVKEFFEYWTEPNKSRSKMRWEQEKTWELPLRLSRWANNPINNKTNNQTKTGNVHQTTIPAAKSGFRVQSGK